MEQILIPRPGDALRPSVGGRVSFLSKSVKDVNCMICTKTEAEFQQNANL